MLNQIILMGRLTRDPEVRHTQSGIPVARFTLAVERDFGPKDEKKQTDFINIVSWRSTAEFVSKHFRKGQLVAVAGRLQINEWTDENSMKHRDAEVVAENVYFAEGRDKSAKAEPKEPYPRDKAYDSPVSNGFAEYDDDDGDLPF